MSVPPLPLPIDPSATFEDVVNQLLTAKDNILADKVNLDRTIAYFNVLVSKGLSVSAAIPELELQKVAIDTFLDAKKLLLATQLAEISTFASQIHDQIPDLSSIV